MLVMTGVECKPFPVCFVWVLGVCRYPLALFVLLALWVAVKGRTQTNTPLSGSDYRSLVVTSAVLCGGLPLVQVRRQGSEEGGGPARHILGSRAHT